MRRATRGKSSSSASVDVTLGQPDKWRIHAVFLANSLDLRRTGIPRLLSCHASLPSFASSVAYRETGSWDDCGSNVRAQRLDKHTKAKRKSASYVAASTGSSVRGCTSTMAAAPCKPAPPLAPCSRRTSCARQAALAAAQTPPPRPAKHTNNERTPHRRPFPSY